MTSLRSEVRAFLAEQRAAGKFTPHCDSWMSSSSPEFSRALGARGWLGMTWPKKYGGHERPERDRLTLNEELLAVGAPVAAHWFSERQMGPSILKHGTEQQRERFLPAMARGELYFSIGMSEPDSGSDLASVRTTATRIDKGWRVRGTKVWTSHAHVASHLLALVRTSPLDTAARHQGLSQLLIDLRAPGMKVRPIRSLDGETHFCEVFLDDVEVGEDALLGAEGSGWSQVTAELAYERSGPERFFSTAPLLFELVRRRAPHLDAELGQLLAEFTTLRTLASDVADALQAGQAPVLEAALVKDLGTRFEGRVIDVARRLLPVEPDLRSTDDFARLLAEAVLHAPAFTLRGGTNEILRGIVARTMSAS